MKETHAKHKLIKEKIKKYREKSFNEGGLDLPKTGEDKTSPNKRQLLKDFYARKTGSQSTKESRA